MLALLAALALQEGWWDPAWGCRRALSVRNGGEEAFAAGLPLELEIDPDFLGLRDRARPGLADLAVVRGGRRIPHVLRPSADGRRLALAFPLAEALAPGASDAGYALYYGNPAGAPPPASPFPLFEDFSGAEPLDVGALSAGVREGALEIRDAPAERSALTPERLALKTGPIPEAFALSFDVETVFVNTPSLAVCVDVRLLEPGLTAADLKPAAELMEQLGADDLELRERATQALIALGPAALPALAEAARSADAELRARAERITAAIRKKAPAPLLRAGLVCSELYWKTAAVGGAASSQGAGRTADGAPRRFRFEIVRDPEGHVTVSCDGQRLQRGRLPGAPGSVSIAVWKTQAAKPGPIRLDNLFLRAYVDPETRPSTTIDVEQSRP